MPLRPGNMDRRVSLERLTPTRNSRGEEVEAWTAVATLWAQRMPDKGGESFTVEQRSARQEVNWRIRWRDGVQPKMSLVFEGTRYEILDVQELERRAGLVLKTYALEVEPGSD